MSIIKEVGRDYFESRFSNCFFIGPSGNTCIIRSRSRPRDAIDCVEVKSVKNQVVTTDVAVPHSFFTDMGVFKTPPLGYRHDRGGLFLASFYRDNTSYTRGVCTANLKHTYALHTQLLMRMKKLPTSTDEYYSANLIMKPKFLSVGEGVEAMNKGKLLSFAASADVAVIPQEGDNYGVAFRGVKVADLTPEGEMMFDVNGDHEPADLEEFL